MRTKTKKQQRFFIDSIKLVIILLVLLGWHITNSLIGTLAIVVIGVVAIPIYRVWKIYNDNQRIKQSGISVIDQMTGIQFEEYISILFKSQGYNVKATPVTGDYGADVILKKDNQITVVQSKRYKKNVGVKAVQEIIPAMKMYRAFDAWVITNSYYTKQALVLAKRNNVRMINRDELIQMSVDMQRK